MSRPQFLAICLILASEQNGMHMIAHLVAKHQVQHLENFCATFS